MMSRNSFEFDNREIATPSDEVRREVEMDARPALDEDLGFGAAGGARPGAGVFHSSDEALNDRDAAGLADGAAALANATAAAPVLEPSTGELSAAVRDKMLGQVTNAGNNRA